MSVSVAGDFADELLPGEKVLWSGKSTITFLEYVRFRVWKALWLVTIVVLAVVVYFIINVPKGIQAQAFPLILGIALAIGGPVLSIVIVYRLYQMHREFQRGEQSSRYAVTNLRILIRQTDFQFSAQLATLPGMVKVHHSKDIGTIQFQVQGVVSFYRINDVDRVYQIITEAQQGHNGHDSLPMCYWEVVMRII